MGLLYIGVPYYGYGLDPTYLLVLIGAILTMAASAKVNATYAKYKKVRSHSGMTGAQAAEYILHQAGIYDVKIQRVSGDLTDYYHPGKRTLHLSDSVYDNPSVAAIGVAAHECGHAIQHATHYAPLGLRSAIVPAVNICSKASWPVLLLGMLLSWNHTLLVLGIVLFSVSVFFSLLTLPVEFNASSRALKILGQTGLLQQDEKKQAKRVLSAAAMTYVAAAASMILQLLRLVLLFGRDRD